MHATQLLEAPMEGSQDAWIDGRSDRFERTDRLIRQRADRVARSRGFCAADKDCIAQDLWIHLQSQLHRFDPDRGSWWSWASAVLDRQCKTIWRKRQSLKCAHGREQYSLDAAVLDVDGRPVSLGELTPEASYEPTRDIDLERDVASVIASLTETQRAVALAMAQGTLNSASQELGMSRRAITKTMDELRDIFHDAELDKYL